MNFVLRERLLRGDVDVYAVATGGGAQLQKRLWSPPGASAYLVGASFPYAAHETDTFLGFTPESYCSEGNAIDLAIEAYLRAKRASYLKGAVRPAMGVGVTASVASKTQHRGDHRVFAAAVTDLGYGSFICAKVLLKGCGENFREDDDFTASLVAEDAMMDAFGMKRSSTSMAEIPDAALRSLVMQGPLFMGDGRRGLRGPGAGAVYFPGAFNPLHDGHRAIANAVMEKADGLPVYTICLDAPHKPPLTGIEAWSRVAMFRAEWMRTKAKYPLLLTEGDPLFVDKAKAMPGATFVMGADTLERLLDSRWGIVPAEVLAQLKESGCKFLVTPCEYQGRQLTLASVAASLAIQPEAIPGFQSFDVEVPSIRSSSLRATP